MRVACRTRLFHVTDAKDMGVFVLGVFSYGNVSRRLYFVYELRGKSVVVVWL